MFGLFRKVLLLLAIAWLISFPAAFFLGGIAFSHPSKNVVNIEVMRLAMHPDWDTSFLGRAREVHIPIGDRTNLAATVFGGNSWATVIVLHDADRNRVAALAAAYALWKSGLDVVLVDRRGHGSSDGDLLPLFGGESPDLSALLDRVLVERWSGTQRVGFFGIGDGGTACLVAAANDERIDAVAAEDPAPTAAAFVEDAFVSTFNLPSLVVALQAQVTVFGIAMVSGVPRADLDARPALKRVTVPVFLLRTKGSAKGARVLGVSNALPPGRAQVEELPGEDDPDRYNGLVNFFRRTL